MTGGRGRSLLCAALLVAAGACAPLPPPPAPTGAPTATPPGAPGTSALEREVHRLVNQHRARARLPPLELNDALSSIAREHSREVAAGRRPFGHDGFDARAAAAARVVALRGFAENVAYDSRAGAALPPSVVGGWIESPGHRENIEGAFQLTGIGSATSRDGSTYFTQLFVAR